MGPGCSFLRTLLHPQAPINVGTVDQLSIPRAAEFLGPKRVGFLRAIDEQVAECRLATHPSNEAAGAGPAGFSLVGLWLLPPIVICLCQNRLSRTSFCILYSPGSTRTKEGGRKCDAPAPESYRGQNVPATRSVMQPSHDTHARESRISAEPISTRNKPVDLRHR